jgi:molybdate transport system substrate-binding protein
LSKKTSLAEIHLTVLKKHNYYAFMHEVLPEVNMSTKIASVILCLVLAMTTAMLCACAEEPRELTVFCGASLTGAFNEIGQLYKNTSDFGIGFNFDSLPALRAQIEQGAYADVLVSANLKHMNALMAEGYLDDDTVKIFAKNKVAVIVPNDNPANITNLMDLARPGIKILIGTKDLPAGDYARRVLDKLANDSEYGPMYKEKVMANIVSEETTLPLIISRVTLGEADAGFAFISDVSPQMTDKVTRIYIPDKYNVLGDFPIGVLKQSKYPQQSQNFIDLVMSAKGQAILKKYGFIPVATIE